MIRGQPKAPLEFAATAVRASELASAVEEISLTRHQDLLTAGVNVLAIHALNDTADDPQFVVLPELIATRVGMTAGQGAYFTAPTPGGENGAGAVKLGPIVKTLATSKRAWAGEDLVVRARVGKAFAGGKLRDLRVSSFQGAIQAERAAR